MKYKLNLLDSFYGYVYKKLNNSVGFVMYFWLFLRKMILKIHPTASCWMQLHGVDMAMPFDHSLPAYLISLQFYDRLPIRLSSFIGEKCGSVNCIDIGANIGDTIAAFQFGRGGNPDDFYIAVEPNPYYGKYLDLNLGDKGVIFLPYLCSHSEGDGFVAFKELNGTASALLGDQPHIAGSTHIKKTTVDNIVEFYSNKRKVNLLKTDTDGHDFDVIAGAKNFISSSNPFVLMEVDSFTNQKFQVDVKNTLSLFLTAGYSKVFIYDNQGCFLGLYGNDDIDSIDRLIFYKLSKKYYYFDFLFMSDCYVEEFLDREHSFYAGKESDFLKSKQ